MMALAGVELETLVSEPDALSTRPPPCSAPQTLGYREELTKIIFRTLLYLLLGNKFLKFC